MNQTNNNSENGKVKDDHSDEIYEKLARMSSKDAQEKIAKIERWGIEQNMNWDAVKLSIQAQMAVESLRFDERISYYLTGIYLVCSGYVFLESDALADKLPAISTVFYSCAITSILGVFSIILRFRIHSGKSAVRNCISKWISRLFNASAIATAIFLLFSGSLYFWMDHSKLIVNNTP